MGAKMGHPVSKETCKRISEAKMGHPVTEETREKISKAKKGVSNINAGNFKKGMVPHNKGLPYKDWMTEEGITKLRPFAKGHKPHNAGKHQIAPLHDIYYCTVCGKRLTERQVSCLLCRPRLNGKHPDVWACSMKCNAIIGARKRTGENHPNWRGGLSYEPYGKGWKQRKIEIRDRDNHQCQLCGKKETTGAFDVHHIDYDKTNLDPNNLITLCKSCHMKTGFHREQWISVFKTLFLFKIMILLEDKGKVRAYKKL